jgi:hypothetical protein
VALLPLQVLFLNLTLAMLSVALASGWALIVELEKVWRRRRSADAG